MPDNYIDNKGSILKDKTTIVKAASLLILISLMVIALTACDMLPFFAEQYDADISISGLKSPDHHSIFTISNNYNDVIIDWQEEDEVEGGSLSGTLTDLRREVEIELRIDNQEIIGYYSTDADSIVVDAENNQAEFRVEFDYEPAVTEITISGPEIIYPAREQGDAAEYEYEVEVLDQLGNPMEKEEVDWSLEGNPTGVAIEKGVVSAAWDSEPGNFQITASSQTDSDIFAQKMVEIDYLPEEEETLYQQAFAQLDDKVEVLELSGITEDFELPELVEISAGSQEENYSFEILWSAEGHEAIEIEGNQALVTVDEDQNVEGYLTAFLQPGKETEAPEITGGDPREKNYPAVVLKPVILKSIIEFEHSFPAAQVDDFYELDHLEVRELEFEAFPVRELSAFSPDETQQEPKEIVVGLYSGTAIQEAVNSLEENNYRVIDSSEVLKALLVEVPEAKGLSTGVQELSALAEVRYAEPNSSYHLLNVQHPDDEYYSLQWHYPQIRLPQAWDITTGSNSISIAVLDTGVNVNHPDLGDQVDTAAGYNFVDGNHDFSDNHGHGTHVAGTISANSNNSEGVAGVMWESRIIPVKVLGDDGIGGLWEIAEGMLYAAGLEGDSGITPLSEPADIINLSLGAYFSNDHMQEAAKRVAEEGVIIIAAAGNDGRNRLMYPAGFPEVISVGAVDFNYPGEPELAPYSNYSSQLDILAPGGDLGTDSDGSGYNDGVLSTGIFEGDLSYVFMTGTSMAAPHVSGVAGLMLAQGISPAEVRKTLLKTSMSISSFEYEAGLINSYWAVNQVGNIELTLYRDKEGELIEIDSKIIPLGQRSAEFKISGGGDYLLEAQVDVRNTGQLEPGDYTGSAGLKGSSRDSGEGKEVTIILREKE